MASIAKSASGYRVQVYVKGVRESASFRTKREAEAWAASRETALRAWACKPVGMQHTLGEALRKYDEEISPTKRSGRWESVRIKAMLADCDFPSKILIAQVAPEDLAAWRDARLKKVEAGTVLRDFKLIASIFEAARREWRWVESNPVRDVRKPRAPDHRDVVISRVQIKAMLREMGYRPGMSVRSVTGAVAVCFLVALRTGMRAGELCGLTWDRVFDGWCRLPVTKTVPRDVPLTRKALRLINSMRGFDEHLVFGIKTASIDALFRKYRQRAGLSGFTFHDTRHTAATWIAGRMSSKGLPAQQAVLDLCKIFGWKNTSQALTYYNPSAAEIAGRMG